MVGVARRGRVLAVLVRRRAEAVRQADCLGVLPELILHRDAGDGRERLRLDLVALEVVRRLADRNVGLHALACLASRRGAHVVVRVGTGGAVGGRWVGALTRRRVARRIEGALVVVRRADGGVVVLVADAGVTAGVRAQVPVGVGARRAVGKRWVRALTRRRVARRVAG